MSHLDTSFKLIPDDWKIKTALCGVADCSHIYFEVFTHIDKGRMASEKMVMMTIEDYDYLIKESKFWEKRNISIMQGGLK